MIDLSASGYMLVCVDKQGNLKDDTLIVNPKCGAGSGINLSRILEKLDIGIIVHGHKPRRSGTQADYQFSEWIPKVRMIGNDTNVSRKGIGATVFRITSRGAFDMDFINTVTESDELRRKVQGILSEPFESDAEGPFVDTQQTTGHK